MPPVSNTARAVQLLVKDDRVHVNIKLPTYDMEESSRHQTNPLRLPLPVPVWLPEGQGGPVVICRDQEHVHRRSQPSHPLEDPLVPVRGTPEVYGLPRLNAEPPEIGSSCVVLTSSCSPTVQDDSDVRIITPVPPVPIVIDSDTASSWMTPLDASLDTYHGVSPPQLGRNTV